MIYPLCLYSGSGIVAEEMKQAVVQQPARFNAHLQGQNFPCDNGEAVHVALEAKTGGGPRARSDRRDPRSLSRQLLLLGGAQHLTRVSEQDAEASSPRWPIDWKSKQSFASKGLLNASSGV